MPRRRKSSPCSWSSLVKASALVLALVPISSSAGIVRATLTCPTVTFKDGTPVIQGFNKLQTAGMPVLPAKSYILALPPGSKVISVNMSHGVPEVLKGSGLRLSPPRLPLCADEKATREAIERHCRNKALLESGTGEFPARPVYWSKMSHFRNIPFIRISYFPILHTHRGLLFYRNCDVVVHHTTENADNHIPDWVHESASQYFSNWDEIGTCYKICVQENPFDYVILTQDSLFSAFDSLVAWKNDIGLGARLVSLDSVITDYPGSDSADKIRNFLIDKYIPWGIRYFLIGGNVNTIPMKTCYPDSQHNYPTLTDYYFAELTDDWDSDGDGFCGEYGQDSIGFVPEVIVGRFPYNDPDTLSIIAAKTVRFEKDRGAWKKRALLLGSFANFENEDSSGYPECDGAVLMEVIKDSLLGGWEYTRMYEDEGLRPSAYSYDRALTNTNAVDQWSGGNYAITNWSAHGSSFGAYRKWWKEDNGDSVAQDSEIQWETFIKIADTELLDDMHPSIIFAASCSNARGEINIARALLRNGAAGIIAATHFGWYIPGWQGPSDGDVMSLDYYFHYYMIAENRSVGDALFDAKVFYFNNLYFPDPWAGDPEWSPQQNLLDYVLFGDPSLQRAGDFGVEEESDYQLATGNGQLSVHPNPFTRKTVIQFRVRGSQPEADVLQRRMSLWLKPLAQEFVDKENAVLRIHDLSGRLIKSFPITKSPNQQITKLCWDAGNSPAGIYFAKLIGNGFTETRKLILVQ